MAGWTRNRTLPCIKPASRPRKGGFKQSAEFITWGVKGTYSTHTRRDLYLPGPLPGRRVDRPGRSLTWGSIAFDDP
ncbi:DNA methylase [Streptomyces sp. SPB074]|nr:DNA methylase [Streptomyces sp. SPB074]